MIATNHDLNGGEKNEIRQPSEQLNALIALCFRKPCRHGRSAFGVSCPHESGPFRHSAKVSC